MRMIRSFGQAQIGRFRLVPTPCGQKCFGGFVPESYWRFDLDQGGEQGRSLSLLCRSNAMIGSEHRKSGTKCQVSDRSDLRIRTCREALHGRFFHAHTSTLVFEPKRLALLNTMVEHAYDEATERG